MVLFNVVLARNEPPCVCSTSDMKQFIRPKAQRRQYKSCSLLRDDDSIDPVCCNTNLVFVEDQSLLRDDEHENCYRKAGRLSLRVDY